MSAHGQLGLDGSEQVDPRVEKAARALWWDSAKATWARDGNDVAQERAKALWPRQAKHYRAQAELALRAAGVL